MSYKTVIKKFICFLVVLLEILSLTGCSLQFPGKASEQEEYASMVASFAKLTDLFSRETIDDINSGTVYPAYYFTMDRDDNWNTEELEFYTGWETAKNEYSFRKVTQVSRTLKQINDEAIPGVIYLHLIPSVMYENSDCDYFLYSKEAYRLDEIIQSYPETLFQVYIETPALYSFEDESSVYLFRELMDELGNMILHNENVAVTFMGDCEWLVGNTANYETATRVNNRIASINLIYLLCETYLLTLDDFAKRLDAFTLLGNEYSGKCAEYPDFSDRYMVFMGDSVFRWSDSSSSISQTCMALSSASGVNCAVGGSSASRLPDAPTYINLSEVIDLLLREKDYEYRRESAPELVLSLEKFFDDMENGALDGKKLTFVLEYGTNDYLIGLPIDGTEEPECCLKGALTCAVARIKDAYPEAEIILLAPGYIRDTGTQEEADEKGDLVIAAYREAVKSVADENGVLFFSMNEFAGIDASNCREYLDDTVHPSPEGRFMIATRFLEELKKVW